MNIADLIIIIFLIVAVVRGARAGSIRQILSTGGFIGGLVLGTWISKRFIYLAHTSLSRSWLALIITLGTGLILLGVGEYIGNLIKFRVEHHSFNNIDRGLGSVIGVIATLILIWFAAAILVGLPYPTIQNQVRGSTIVSFLNERLPSAPNMIADFSHAIDPNGFPRVFTGPEPAPINQNIKLPSSSALLAAVKKDETSVVKIEGTGCGGIVEGSGFVISPDLVATNAHVVAGVKHPYVIDANGNHPATPIWFDPNLDFAILQVSNLAGRPLHLNTAIAANGTPAGVLGYPGGGSFTADSAAILDEFIATGRNIYQQGNTNRNVYEIKANVIPGNSGGPLINLNGNVIGIVFAESTTYNHVGYALTLQHVVKEIQQAESNIHQVSTGACAE